MEVVFRYPRWRALATRHILARERGQCHSTTIRKLFKHYYDIEIGMYTYGGCFEPGNMSRRLRIGRYCSFAPLVYVYSADHPMERLSQHPFFYNSDFGMVDLEQDVPRGSLVIGHDVWVGQNVIMLSGVSTIGHGAVLAAGAIVTKDVPDFAVVGGCPARILRYRFSEPIQKKILAMKWWHRRIEDIRRDGLEIFLKPAFDAFPPVGKES